MLTSSSTILLTGGTSGIGLALLQQLHAQGHTLIVIARNQHKLLRLQTEYERVTTYKCDLSSREHVESLCDEIAKTHPELNIVINNAGVQHTPCFIDNDFSYDTIEYETTVNYLAPVWISYLLLPVLLNNNKPSAIVNISSGLVFAPKKNSAVYCASKAALHSISQSLRYQLAETNVTVHEAIMPLVETPMTAGRNTKYMLSADEAARQIIKGMMYEKNEVYVGRAKLLRLLMRISPALVKRMMRRH